MKNKRMLYVIVLLLTFLFSTFLLPLSSSTAGTISGTVIGDADKGLQGVVVKFYTKAGAFVKSAPHPTDSKGKFGPVTLSKGSYLIGFEPKGGGYYPGWYLNRIAVSTLPVDDNATPVAVGADNATVADQELFDKQLVAAFPGWGTYFYNRNTWTSELTAAIPNDMKIIKDTDGNSTLVASFSGVSAADNGLYATHAPFRGQEQSIRWTKLSQVASQQLEMDNYKKKEARLYADFGDWGLYMLTATKKNTIDEASADGNWSQISPQNPGKIKVGNGLLLAGFGSQGLYLYNPTGTPPANQAFDGNWTQINKAEAKQINFLQADADSTTWANKFFVEFGGGWGPYMYDPATDEWAQISFYPENLAYVNSVLYGDFGVLGLWASEDGVKWTELNKANPDSLVKSGSLLYVDFGALGLWVLDNEGIGSALDAGNWYQISTDNTNPDQIKGTDDGSLYADFGYLGLWKFDANAWNWTIVTKADPSTPIVCNTGPLLK